MGHAKYFVGVLLLMLACGVDRLDKYTPNSDRVTIQGNYDNGQPSGEWVYWTDLDSVKVRWTPIQVANVKLSLPDNLRINENARYPFLFQGDFVDGDKNTYMALLRYDLGKLKKSDYDYLAELHRYMKSDSSVVLESMDFKKLTYKDAIVYRATFDTRSSKSYRGTSYIFVANNMLYDLAYKRVIERTEAISDLIFKDVLYGMECDGVDLHAYSKGKFVKEEKVTFND